jgi:hypothetical protein
MSALARRTMPLALALALALACGAEAPRRDVPGEQLLARAEARLARERDALRPSISHYALVFPVEREELDEALRAVRVHGAGIDLALGTQFALEPHGGGVLRLLFDHWRPAGRAAAAGDRYPFAGAAAPPALGELYAAARARLFLPVPGLAADAAGARLPDTPQLPRLLTRFGLPGGPLRSLESDAWKLLGLALRLEPDAARTWTSRSGQALSLALLLRHVRDSELASGPHATEPADHSALHRIELLAAWAARGGDAGLAAVQRHFLEVALAPRAFDPAPGVAGRLIAHQAESLGHLLGAPSLRWAEPERERVRGWLAGLEAGGSGLDVERDELAELCHLVAGLRAVREHRAVLE